MIITIYRDNFNLYRITIQNILNIKNENYICKTNF